MALSQLGSAVKGKARILAPLLQETCMSESHMLALKPITCRPTLRVHSRTAPSFSRSISDLALPSSSSSSTVAAEASSAVSLVTQHVPHVVESRTEALDLLRAQPVHYVVASIAGRTLLLHARDLFSLPRLNDVQVGDVIELDRIHELGSRDYTLRAQDPISTRTSGALALLRRSVTHSSAPSNIQLSLASGQLQQLKDSQSWAARLRPGGLAHVGAVLDKNVVRVRCTVVEHTKGPMEMIVKKKRRKGYKRTIRHKQTYTRVRVEAIQVGHGGEEAEI